MPAASAGDERSREQRQQESIESITRGGLPLEAQERLKQVAAARSGDGFCFTSDLSVNEFLMARRHKLVPITQVMGSAVYHLGWQYMQGGWFGGPQELRVSTDAYNHARTLAVGRLRQEAELAGADGVVGVHITAGSCDWGSDLIEFRSLGTAVSTPSLRTHDHPNLSNLSGQEVGELLEAGFVPLGLVGATSVYYGCLELDRAYQMRQVFGGTRWQNFEMTEFAEAWWQARNHAMLRIRQQANDLAATGIVGVTWHQSSREHNVTYNRSYGGYSGTWQAGYSGDVDVPGVIYTVHVLATAVAELERAEPPPIYTMLPLKPRSTQ